MARMARVARSHDDIGAARRAARALLPYGMRSYIMRGRRAVRVLRRRDGMIQIRGLDDDVQRQAQIGVYFGDDASRLYQLEQWLPGLGQLHDRRRVVVVLRNLEAYRALCGRTTLPAICLPRFDQLIEYYADANLAVTLYVNNSRFNFQSLADRSPMHIHVSHGESDKMSMASNQVKAYDRVFVAGEAAIRRFRRALLGPDLSRLVTIGRPQLALPVEPALPPSDRRTILYAPTWEGEDDSNNYTSIDKYGPQIVAA